MWTLNYELQSDQTYNRFFKAYSKDYKKFKSESLENRDKNRPNKKLINDINILRPFLRTYKVELICSATFKFFSIICGLIQPFLLDIILTYVKSNDPIIWKGYFYAICILLASILESMINNQYEYSINKLAVSFKSALISTIYS